MLEDANIKLADVATDIMGVSGRAIRAALLEGTADPTTMADLTKGRLRCKREALERTVSGHMGAHHRTACSLPSILSRSTVWTRRSSV